MDKTGSLASKWNVSEKAAALHAGALVCDMTLPWVQANPERYPEGYSPNPADWKHFQPEQLPQVTEALLKRKYSEEEIRGILGQNFLRVARQVWKQE